MVRFFLFILLVVLVGLGVYWASSLEGSVLLNLPGYEIRTPVIVAALLLLLLGALMALFWTSILGLWNLPGKIGKSRLRGKEKKANTALVEGLLAAEGGDATTARKLAARAQAHAADQRLVLLLEARAAEEAEDWADAERAWAELRRMPGAQLAGLKGLATAALQRGDTAVAEQRNREALQLKTQANWPFQALFDLQVAGGNWVAAIDTLAAGERRGLVAADSARRRRAVLLTAEAVRLAKTDRLQAQRTLADAIRSAPGFPPAAWHGARHLIADGKLKPAQQILELAWKARPHPSLARLARTPFTEQETPEAGRKRAQALINVAPEHRESRILSAELALELRNHAAALKALAGVLEEEQPTSRLCILMTEALRGYGDRSEAERWQRLAGTAARELDWSDLDAKGGAFAYEQREWSRLVYEFGDAARLIHPQHEAGARQLEPVARPKLIAAPEPEKPKPATPPRAPDEPQIRRERPIMDRPPLDYAPPED